MINLNPASMISKLFENKKFLVAFSVVCAIVFWLVIDITENPSRDITFSDIPVTVAEQADDNDRVLIPIGNYVNNVSVTVNGPGYLVSTVSKDDIKVSVKSYADVSEPGTYMLTLTASVSKTDCEVVSITPPYIQVVYDYNTATEIPVEVDVSELNSFLAEGCEIDTAKSKLRSEADGSEITTLSIKGPSEIISSIKKVVAKPIVSGKEFSSQSQNFEDVKYAFYDAMGNEVSSNSLEYKTDYYLRVVVFKRATVNLVPTFANLPACYVETHTMPSCKIYRNDERTKAKTLITQIEVKGPVEKVNSLVQNGLKLTPIDFEQIDSDKDKSFLRSFILEEGVEIVDGTEEVIVEIDFGGKLSTSKEFSINPAEIKLINTGGNNLEVNYTGAIKVTLCGNADDIKKIKASDITLTIDCAGGVISENGEDKPITVSVSSKYRAWKIKISKAQVQVVVK